MVLKNFSKEILIAQNDSKNVYVNSDWFTVNKPALSNELGQKFCEHFVLFFEMFYGQIEKTYFIAEDDKFSLDFEGIFDKYILSYKKLNSITFPRINMLKYNDSYLNYAPIDKKVFLAIHYLLDVIKSIDKQIKHQITFYNGYFILSTFDNKIVQPFYDYFFLSGDTLCIDTNKIFQKFSVMAPNSQKNSTA